MDATNEKKRCEICHVDVHRASMVKHLRSKKYLDYQMIIPQNFFIEQSTSRQSTTKNIILNL